ncbi:806_t:CDS:2 [Dentiscutata erythropus]|uniref:806_t:CDS:1 n=1 Tax=Dentiscutata erythropus TaxID=1348616 RepID=A0A9N9J5F9_9GLOM|nr:806_t:CDS:2 [Dentiscutata erythropus]
MNVKEEKDMCIKNIDKCEGRRRYLEENAEENDIESNNSIGKVDDRELDDLEAKIDYEEVNNARIERVDEVVNCCQNRAIDMLEAQLNVVLGKEEIVEYLLKVLSDDGFN